MGFRRRVAVFDPQSQALITLNATERFSGSLTGRDAYAYRIVAPISLSWIALIGDVDKFVPMGRERITAYRDLADGAALEIAYAVKETNLTIAGYAKSPITTRAEGASVESVDRDTTTGLFKVKLRTDGNTPRRIILTLRRRP
jgi:hypothetical protein